MRRSSYSGQSTNIILIILLSLFRLMFSLFILGFNLFILINGSGFILIKQTVRSAVS